MPRYSHVWCFCLSATTAIADPYTNTRFGFSVDVPARAQLQSTSENGDGWVFTLGRSDSTLTVSGAFSLLDDLHHDQDSLRYNLRSNEDLVTYETRGDGWYVLSGISVRDTIFYVWRREAVACDGTSILITVYFDYAREAAAIVDPLIASTTQSVAAPMCN